MNANPKFLNTAAEIDAAAVPPLPNSRKTYVDGVQDGVRVPMREISQADTAALIPLVPSLHMSVEKRRRRWAIAPEEQF